MGVGTATSSHCYGLIQETVETYEVVLADGSLAHATRTEHGLLPTVVPECERRATRRWRE